MKSTLKENAKSKPQYVYFIRLGKPCERLFKIGTTNDIDRRMKEHKRYYKKDVTVLGVIKLTSRFTTLRVEERTIEKWKHLPNWKYLRNDRFIIPKDVTKVDIQVRKIYSFAIA